MSSTREILLALREEIEKASETYPLGDGCAHDAISLGAALECVDRQLQKLEGPLCKCGHGENLHRGLAFPACPEPGCGCDLSPKAEPLAEEKPYDFAEVRRRAHQEYSEAPEPKAAERCQEYGGHEDLPCRCSLPCPAHPKEERVFPREHTEDGKPRI
jgi:hypothetical protein